MEDDALLPRDVESQRYVKSPAWRWLAVWMVITTVCTGLIFVGFAYFALVEFNCRLQTCDWVPNWHLSACNSDGCYIYWNVVIDGVTRSLLWSQKSSCSSCFYVSNSTTFPPYENGTACYMPKSCETYQGGVSDWWIVPGACQPVLECYKGNVPSRNGYSIMIVISIMVPIALLIALAMWADVYACKDK